MYVLKMRMKNKLYKNQDWKLYPSAGIELGFEMNQVSEVNECILQSTPLPPLSINYFMPEKETCEFQFHMDI